MTYTKMELKTENPVNEVSLTVRRSSFSMIDVLNNSFKRYIQVSISYISQTYPKNGLIRQMAK